MRVEIPTENHLSHDTESGNDGESRENDQGKAHHGRDFFGVFGILRARLPEEDGGE